MCNDLRIIQIFFYGGHRTGKSEEEFIEAQRTFKSCENCLIEKKLKQI